MLAAREVQLLPYEDRVYLWVDHPSHSEQLWDVTNISHHSWFYQDAHRLLTMPIKDADSIPGNLVKDAGLSSWVIHSVTAAARAEYDHLESNLTVTQYGTKNADASAYLGRPMVNKVAPVLMMRNKDGSTTYVMKF